MLKRGRNPSLPDRRWYGESGVGVCERWVRFESFRDELYQSYLDHAAQHGEANTSLDRICNDDGYYPENVRWATMTQQARNRSTVSRYEFDGKSLTLAEWGELLGIDGCTLKMRIRNGWSLQRTFTEPVKPSLRGRWIRTKNAA